MSSVFYSRDKKKNILLYFFTEPNNEKKWRQMETHMRIQ